MTRKEFQENLNLKRGETVHCILRHVSRSGMQRVIQLVVFRKNQPLWIGYAAAKLLGYRYDENREGIIVGGCGMDMGFHLVYNLSNALFCLKKYDHDSAYALKHSWL